MSCFELQQLEISFSRQEGEASEFPDLIRTQRVHFTAMLVFSGDVLQSKVNVMRMAVDGFNFTLLLGEDSFRAERQVCVFVGAHHY